MYKLKKVEMLGFKSFADRTRLEFADGVAAVVGPNGCGKSNLSDAISWVLGEQSARMLRGERMADVIFNGTGTRPPTGLAEVSLTLVDPEYVADPAENETGGKDVVQVIAGRPEEDLPPTLNFTAETVSDSIEPEIRGSNGHGHTTVASQPVKRHRSSEITVTRRLFRSGESEYLINGEICRLRDIQDLFMGTGLGPESYAIIEQGRIGQILSSKPSDRRAIIEEAAGVSKFKSRKRLAEAKLESSRQNLARITDILEEVTKQVNSLKRQAGKARRYREMHKELRGRLKLVLTSRMLALENESHRLHDELAILQDQCSLAGQQLAELEREQKTVTLRHEELETRLTQSRESLAQGDLERQRLESQIEHVHQQAASLSARLTEAATESDNLQAQLESLDRESTELNSRTEQFHREWAMARKDAAELLAQKTGLMAQVSTGETEAEAARQSLLVAVSEAADLRNQLVQAEEIGLGLDRQIKRTEAEKLQAEEERNRLKTELEAVGSDHMLGESTLAGLAQAVSDTTQSLDLARGDAAACRTELETLRQDCAGVAARKQALEESLARHAYTTESVRKLLSVDHPNNGHRFRPMGLLADFMEVSPGYEEVVEEFLKHDLECVVVEGHDEARSGIALLKSEGAGRSTFFVTHFPATDHSNGHSDPEVRGAKGVIANVRDLVRFEPRLGLNGDLPLPDLQNAYMVEDSATAERLAGQYPEYHFLAPSGEHYHHRMVTGGRGVSAGPLALRRDFRELERRTADLESKVREAEATFANHSANVMRLEEQLRTLSSEKQEAEKKALLANEQLRQTRQACDRAADRLQALGDEATGLVGERQAILTREAALRAQLETATLEQKRREEEIERTALLLHDLRAELDTMIQSHAGAQTRAGALEERTHAVEAERARVVAQREEVRARIARLLEQCEIWREERMRLAKESEAVQTRRAELANEQQIARAELLTLEQESQVARARRDLLGPSIDTARATFESYREKRSEVEIAQARSESDMAHQAQQCREELNAEPAQLLADLTPDSALAGEFLLAAEEELRGLKARIEALGPVNMMALEELQESEERYTFLETQRQDLLVSIEDTAQAIREIDQVSSRQFLEAFAAINRNFAESFRTLFGGGIGEMRLSDDSDPDSGLDIVAQPPGKRLQNVLLLSGGEKALAALALLIAVFRFTPSPFCILDEVDAPLDESNVDRFTRLIHQMSQHTQFILITHNKRTMEIAKLMYGVTMEEPGVSKLVSVRFEEFEPEPVAIPA
ncbi:MAG TPA: chromosome segregation protein SMC [Terriglobia bacterium]|nr:chromosome segregation protein SMC [Terriglobia bacterium]